MKKERKNVKWKKTAKFVFLVSFMFVAYTLTNVYVNIQNAPEGTEKSILEWFKAPMVLAANQTLGASTAGIVNIYTVNEETIPDYDSAIVEADTWVFEHCDASFTDADPDAPDEELEDTTPYDTDFAVVVVYQFTEAQAYDSGSWNLSRVKAYMNTTGMDTGGDASSQLMQKGAWYATGADSGCQRINFYLEDGDGGAGTGFQIDIDSTWRANCTVYYKG